MERVGLKHCDDMKVLNENSNDMQDVYTSIAEYNPWKKCKLLKVFNVLIADMIWNKKLDPIVTELFVTGRKLNISLILITLLYFKSPEHVGINITHFLIMKIAKKSFHKLHIMIPQILTWNILWRFTKSASQNRISFQLMIQFR